MNKVMMIWAFCLTILLTACEKDLIQSTTDEVTLSEQQESTEDLSLRTGNYKSMAQLRHQLKNVITEPGDLISAAWVVDENIGLIIGKKYAVINRVNGNILKGNLTDAGSFWKNAPSLKDGSEFHHPTKVSHVGGKTTGITAGWTFGNVLGFTSKNAYWNASIDEFSNPNVWDIATKDNSGLLGDDPFWNVPGIGLPPKDGITAGFLGPNNLFAAFSGTKIFVYSFNRNEWILSQEIRNLQPNNPFYFLKSAPIPQLRAINAAFYNEGVNEYVFMSEQSWAAYCVDHNNWTYGSLSQCFDESKVNKFALCTADYNPVCGCDGISYSNNCEAEKSGIISYTAGKCNSKCFDESKVDKLRPCNKNIAPVCGCDGNTYDNFCLAEKSGITSYINGRCN